jgi:hypothetical protein
LTMTDQINTAIEQLRKAGTAQEFKQAIPESVIERLGRGERGIQEFLRLLGGLATFGSNPLFFSRNAFDYVVCIDDETDKPYPDELAQALFDISIEVGLIKPVVKRTGTYYACDVIVESLPEGLIPE